MEERHCEGDATKQSIPALALLDRFASLAMTESTEMLTKTQHLFDDATRVTPGDSRWSGRTSDDYWAFVGPFGGATAATILRALIEHPQRAGDPLSLTVNFCAPIAQGEFPQGRPVEQILPYTKVAASWVKQYDFRFIEGDPDFSGGAQAAPASAF